MRTTQRQKVLEILNLYRGKRVDFRFFWYSGISQPWSRSSELNKQGYEIQNEWYINTKWQKCSYYSIDPKSSLKESIKAWYTIDSNFINNMITWSVQNVAIA